VKVGFGCFRVGGENDWRDLSPRCVAGRYFYVQLCDGKGVVRQHPIHQLVLTVFEGSCPPGYECAHWDNDKRNNNLCNLRWATRFENAKDKERHGTNNRGESNPNVKITQEIADSIRLEYWGSGVSQTKLAEKYGISISLVCSIINNKAWVRPSSS
jgi:hypothetical protein